MKHLVGVSILSFCVCACSCTDRHGGSAAEAAARPEVAGTVLDRASGVPIEGALVRFPDGREARTDAQGRFVATDLAPGLAGELTARAEDGREGRVTLRPLAPGRLEVVVYAGR